LAILRKISKTSHLNFTLAKKITSWQNFRKNHFCATSIIATLGSFKWLDASNNRGHTVLTCHTFQQFEWHWHILYQNSSLAPSTHVCQIFNSFWNFHSQFYLFNFKKNSRNNIISVKGAKVVDPKKFKKKSPYLAFTLKQATKFSSHNSCI